MPQIPESPQRIIRKAKKTPTWKKVVGGLWYVTVCAVVLALGAGAQWVNRSDVLKQGLKSLILNETPEDIFQRNSLTLLVLGCDEDRAPGGKKVLRENARSDMMMVAKFDFANKRVGAVSIPRDLEVDLPGYSGRKINAYHSIGGPDLARQAAEKVVGVPIDKVVVIDYEAFQKMVDAAGGIEIFVPKKMKWTDRRGGLFIDLEPGRQTLNGYDAMCFVRFRHDALGDHARQDRQKDFMLAFKEAVKKNPGAFPEVTERAEEVLGGAMNSSEIAALGRFMQGVPNESIKMAAVPTLEGRGTNLYLDFGKLPEVLSASYITSPLVTSSSQRVSRR